ncbi:MAG: ketopantoate reductase family protein [Betaproteobacteria bacterium]
MSPFQKITVIGAGGIGRYFGGLLANAHPDVTFLVKDIHDPTNQTLISEGLHILWREKTTHVSIKLTHQIEDIKYSDLILICVKATHTKDIAKLIQPWISQNAVLVSLQNGLNNLTEIKRYIPNTCFSALIYTAVTVNAPNEVSHLGGGEIFLGGNALNESDRSALKNLISFFNSAQIDCQEATNINEALWTKLIINCAFNAMSAIVNWNYANLFKSAGASDLIELILQECLLVAKAEGIYLNENAIRKLILGIPESMALQYSSTAQDLQKKRHTEISEINGAIVSKGIALGIPTPVNQTLLTLVNLIELS